MGSKSLARRLKGTPADQGFSFPPEWYPHRGTLISWPRPEGISFPDRHHEAIEDIAGLIRVLVTREEVHLNVPNGNYERIVAALLSAMLPHATKHRLGVVCGSGLGCWMNSGNLLSPDISFIAKSRLAVTAAEKEKYLRGAPDLVVEVLSPWDRSARLQEKLPDYFSSGARLIWVLDPAEKTVLVYRTPEPDRLLRVTDTLEGEDVLPGFRLPLAELFAELSFE